MSGALFYSLILFGIFVWGWFELFLALGIVKEPYVVNHDRGRAVTPVMLVQTRARIQRGAVQKKHVRLTAFRDLLEHVLFIVMLCLKPFGSLHFRSHLVGGKNRNI